MRTSGRKVWKDSTEFRPSGGKVWKESTEFNRKRPSEASSGPPGANFGNQIRPQGLFVVPIGPPRGPKTGATGRKTNQKANKNGPRGQKIGPKRPRDGPKRPKNRPKTAKTGARRRKKAPGGTEEGHGRGQSRPKTGQEAKIGKNPRCSLVFWASQGGSIRAVRGECGVRGGGRPRARPLP